MRLGDIILRKQNFTQKDNVLLSMKNVNCGHMLQKINLDLRAGGNPGRRWSGRTGTVGTVQVPVRINAISGRNRDKRSRSKIEQHDKGNGSKKLPLFRKKEEHRDLLLSRVSVKILYFLVWIRYPMVWFLSKAKEEKLVAEGMKTLAIKAESSETLTGTLSGGNQQKVVLAKEVATEPDIVLMYDITRGVDVGTKKEMFNITKRFAKEGKAVLFYSTDSEELMNVCNSVIIMNNGLITGRLDDELISRENIIRVSVGEKPV